MADVNEENVARALNWSKWLNLISIDFSLVPKMSGLYQLRWVIDGRPQPINRANNIDDSGCLYIGKTANLYRRIKRLNHGLIQLQTKNVSYTHTAIYTYSYYGFNKKYKPEQIEIRCVEKPKEETDYWEEKLIGDYVEKYLDKPPLNINIRRL